VKIFAIADLHLALGTPEKAMDPFGPVWKNHPKPLEVWWKANIGPDDLILIPGDISWAKKLDEAFTDLAWLDSMPGQKVLLQGNHDYWWSSLKKLKELPFKTLHFIQNNTLRFGDIVIGGSRLWDTHEYSFPGEKVEVAGVKMHEKKFDPEEQERIFVRELGRLRESLKQMGEGRKIVLTHYPPIGKDLKPSRASEIIAESGASLCLFGHLHHVPLGSLPFGKAQGVEYRLISFDYLNGIPIEVTNVI